MKVSEVCDSEWNDFRRAVWLEVALAGAIVCAAMGIFSWYFLYIR